MNAKPIIIFDTNSNLIRFEGIFMAISSWDNRGEIIDDVKRYIVNKEKVLVEFNLIYVDSMSRKVFFEIFNLLKSENKSNSHQISVVWQYDPEDETIFELGKVLQEVVHQKVTFVEIPD